MKAIIFNHRYSILSFIFVMIIIFGNFAIIQKHIIGVVPTYYRVFIPIIFICLAIINEKENKINEYIISSRNNIIKCFFIILLIWIMYACVSLLISPWSIFSEGAKEVMSLVLGAMSIYIVITLIEKGQFNIILFAVKISILVLLVIGYIEIFSGYHLSTSRLSDPQFWESIKESYGNNDVPETIKYMATGIFYNPNDYCAFLSVFSPIYVYHVNVKRKRLSTIINYITLMLIFLIMIVDDAWICIIALIAGLLVHLVIEKAPLIKWIITFGSILLTRFIGEYVLKGALWMLYKFTDNKIFEHYVQTSKVEEAVIVQVDNMSQDTGSMFLRLNTYIESIKEMFVQSKGLGLGAGSYSEYFKNIAESRKMMSNPHSLWIEILSQYGIVIFLIFVSFLIYIFIKLLRGYIKNLNKSYVLVLAMGTCFIFASFAPSSFLKGSYYWLIIGMALGLLFCDVKQKYEKSEKLDYLN